MYDDGEIGKLRDRLGMLTGRNRIPVMMTLAQQLTQRWSVRTRAGLTQTKTDITEAGDLLREARGMMQPDDLWHAQATGMLGNILAVRAFIEGDANRDDNPHRDEAIELLRESVEHPGLPPANLEVALFYCAMMLVVRAIPSGDGLGAGLEGIDGVKRMNPRAAPATLKYLGSAAAEPRKADMDTAVAYLERLQAMPPVNDQIHQVVPMLLGLINVIRMLLGTSGLAGMIAAMPGMTPVWEAQAGLAGASPFDALRTMMSGVMLPQLPAGPSSDAGGQDKQDR